jgi:hypothetical protein
MPKTDKLYDTIRKLSEILEDYLYTELEASLWQLKQSVEQRREQLRKQFTPEKPRKLSRKEKRQLK